MKLKLFFVLLSCFPVCLMSQTKVELSTPGTLSALLTDAQKDTCKSLVVTGKLNSADIRTLRQMAGYGDDGGKLENLDLRNAGFVSDDSPYQTLDAENDCVVATFMSTRYPVFVTGTPKSASSLFDQLAQQALLLIHTQNDTSSSL